MANVKWSAFPVGTTILATDMMVGTFSAVDKQITALNTIKQLNALISFTSAPSVVTGVQPVNAAHGLGATPTKVRGVMRCTTADGAFAVGDEIDCCYWFDVLNARMLFNVRTNATNVICSSNFPVVGNEASVKVTSAAGGGTVSPVSGNNWRLVIYATL
jgi:hypothetical protein